jgi:hypothetical protein
VDVMLGAAIGWCIVFFAVFMTMESLYKGSEEETTEQKSSKARATVKMAEKNKGKKIDITIKDEVTFEDIYKFK